MLYWIGPPGPAGDACFAEVERMVQTAENIKRDPWIYEYRRVKAEVERTGDETLFADFQRRFKRAEAERWGPRQGRNPLAGSRLVRTLGGGGASAACRISGRSPE